MNRREFIHQSAISAFTLSFFSSRFTWALDRPEETNQSNQDPHSLVVIFMRGAVDTLSFLIPRQEPTLHLLRPNLKLTEKDYAKTILNSAFALHPKLNGLHRLYEKNLVSFIAATGSPDPTRSHFDAQDYFESGAPGMKSIDTGFLNRLMTELHLQKGNEEISAISFQNASSRFLRGPNPTISLRSLSEFQLQSGIVNTASFEGMYEHAVQEVIRGTSKDTFKSLEKIKDMLKKQKQKKSEYPNSAIANRLKDIATLKKSNVGLRLAVTEIDGWDSHVNQGVLDGQFAKKIQELDEAIEKFVDDLGKQIETTTILLVSEFGRTVKENGNRGTDHGHGSHITVIGTGLKKDVLGKWPGLSKANLYEGRDLAVTTDFRNVFAEVISKNFDVKNFSNIFPGYPILSDNWVGLYQSTPTMPPTPTSEKV